MKSIIDNFIGILIAFIVGGLAGYLLLPEKTIVKTETKIEYVKVKTKQVITTKPDGSSVAVIDTVSDSVANSDSKTVEKYNERKVTAIGYIGIGREKHAYGLMLQKDVLGKIGVVAGLQYCDTRFLGTIGVSLGF